MESFTDKKTSDKDKKIKETRLKLNLEYLEKLLTAVADKLKQNGR